MIRAMRRFKRKQQTTIVAHSGSFHSDDVFAVATLLLVLRKNGVPKRSIKIIRSRDNDIIQAGTYVVDVGGAYDPGTNRFDHHQRGGAGMRPNGIPYASFGLVWKKYGELVCDSGYIAQILDEKLVQPIDALDNGIDISTPLFPHVYPYRIENIVMAFAPTWKEKSDPDDIFEKLVYLIMPLIEREIKSFQDIEEGKRFVEDAYREAKDKRVIIMKKDYPWQSVLSKYKEPLYVVYPSEQSSTWRAKAVRDDFHQFKSRKEFPAKWAGKRDAELAKITGVADATFCHNKRFIVVATSKEGVLKLVEEAINA